MIKLPIDPRYKLSGLSWSSLVMIEKDPDEWYQTYVLGHKRPPTEAMKFGTKIHKQIAERKFRGKLKNIYHGNNPETQLSCKIFYTKTKFFNLIGTPDDYKSIDETLIEYKTGTKLWTQKQAENHGQLSTYSLLLKKARKIIIKKAFLVSLETKRNEKGKLVLTGKTRVLEVKITTPDPRKIQARFINDYKLAIKTIQEHGKR
jgi:CRISPR/Cas system-associated exonuclease Cas4 (RecB family)